MKEPFYTIFNTVQYTTNIWEWVQYSIDMSFKLI